MSLSAATAPYASLLKWGLIAGLLIGVYVYGRGDGSDAQRKDDETEIRSAELQAREAKGHRDALKRAMRAHARTFRAISAITAANERQAAARAQAARTANEEATIRRNVLEQRIRELAAESEREKFTCSQAEMRICGVPLQ